LCAHSHQPLPQAPYLSFDVSARTTEGGDDALLHEPALVTPPVSQNPAAEPAALPDTGGQQ
jgi:hypothetical protein